MSFGTHNDRLDLKKLTIIKYNEWCFEFGSLTIGIDLECYFLGFSLQFGYNSSFLWNGLSESVDLC